MSSEQIADQINLIREATDKASASPEAALEFLRSAGIIGPVKKQSPDRVTNKHQTQLPTVIQPK